MLYVCDTCVNSLRCRIPINFRMNLLYLHEMVINCVNITKQLLYKLEIKPVIKSGLTHHTYFREIPSPCQGYGSRVHLFR